MVIWSSGTLLTKPKLWIDEAMTINTARSFMTHGVLSPETAPNTFFQFPHLVQSTGYPLTLTLAGFFKVFGYGFYQARILMLLWIVAALSLVFFLAKKLFSREQACWSLLLISSFASFYANGRTAVGEIPGFAFLLAGFYFMLVRRRYFWAGIFWGLSVVTKPSVFGLVIPAIFLTFLLERSGFFRKIVPLALGMMPAAVVWILLLVPRPFNGETWLSIAHFYKNPYSSSIAGNVIRNLSGVFHSTTLIYFGLFFLLVLGARLLLKETRLSSLYTFTLVYSLLAFVYYLRSPGWLRYILIAELLILFILPPVIGALTAYAKERLKKVSMNANTFANFILGFLVIVQIAQMFTIAKIFAGDNALRTAVYLEKNFPDSAIGLLNAPELAILLNPSRVFLAVYLTGLPIIGENPLLLSKPPAVIVSPTGNPFAAEGRKILYERYGSSSVAGGYGIYKRSR